MGIARIIAGIWIVVALSVAPVNADIILEIDVSNPTMGFSIADVSGSRCRRLSGRGGVAV